MTDFPFKTYTEAAAYAKKRAQELRVPVKFGRNNNQDWVVVAPELSGNEKQSHQQQSESDSDPWDDFPFDEQQQKAIESWNILKAQHAPCYACGGYGGRERVCKTCMGRCYING